MTLYYYTYRLPSGGWQSTAISESKEEAEDVASHHAQGRRYIIAELEEELEKQKSPR